MNEPDNLGVYREIGVCSAATRNREFAEAVCKHLEMPLGGCNEVFEFSNEQHLRAAFCDNIRERDVFLIQPIALAGEHAA